MKYDHIDFQPPESVALQAEKGLEYRRKAGGKGGLSVEQAKSEGVGSGVQRAVNLKNRDILSPETVKRMKAFFTRHEKKKKIDTKYKDEPWKDKGYVAHLLWGGDAGYAWSKKIVDLMDKAGDKQAKAPITHGYNSYGSVWTPLKEIKQLEVEERGNEWFDDSKLDLNKTKAIWITEDPRDAVLYNLSAEFRNIIDDHYKNNSLPEDVPPGTNMAKEDYQEERKIFLNAQNEVTKVSVNGALSLIEHHEPFGKAYLFIKPVQLKQKMALRIATSFLKKIVSEKY